jgi:hypothetical protein
MLIVQRANGHHFPQVGGSAQLRIGFTNTKVRHLENLT